MRVTGRSHSHVTEPLSVPEGKQLSLSDGQTLCSPWWRQGNASLLLASLLLAWSSETQTPVWHYTLEDRFTYVLREGRAQKPVGQNASPGDATPTQASGKGNPTRRCQSLWEGKGSKWTSMDRMSQYLILTHTFEKNSKPSRVLPGKYKPWNLKEQSRQRPLENWTSSKLKVWALQRPIWRGGKDAGGCEKACIGLILDRELVSRRHKRS